MTHFWIDGDGLLRIENAGPFTRRDAIKIARWLLDMFGEGQGRQP